jgi:CRISPR/Cas system CSM-associated protein Csm3 (group 7 of RAMP superfamily)
VKAFTLELQFPAGAPLVGGYAPLVPGLHAAHARRPRIDGRGNKGSEPYVPSTALRGALREALEALLRGQGLPACERGTGIDPEQPPAADQSRPKHCELDGGGPCVPCCLFGTHGMGLRSGQFAFSALVLGDGAPKRETDWAVRHSVSIDRSRRSASNQRLLARQVPAVATGRPLVFEARGRLLEPGLQGAFEAAVRATTHVGSGRSRGLGRLELHLRWDETSALSAAAAELPGDGDVLVRVTLASPALVGTAVVDPNVRESRTEIPGSAVRGAVGFVLAEILAQAGSADPDRDPRLRSLVGDGGDGVGDGTGGGKGEGAHFGFLWATDNPAAAPAIPGPLPITARACKREGRAHGLVDELIDRLVLLHAGTAIEAERATGQARNVCRAPGCGAPLRAARGTRLARELPAMRVITRVAIDRTGSSAADGELFSQILLERGTVLEGTIRNVPPAGRAQLAEVLRSARLSLGRGRSQGWGQAKVEVTPAPVLAPVDVRGEAFDAAVTARLMAAGLSTERVGTLVPVTLLAPLWLAGGAADEELLARELGASGYFLKARRYAREGAWDQRRGQMQPCWAVAAGAVFVVDLGRGHWRDFVPALVALERHGVGPRRHQGYGQVLCFDPWFLPAEKDDRA